ncbi:MAG: MaoC/PaaZ C-terminal domain-containing protein [Chloroflexi bacterium]|nr:MaoC/PaaZ C-terminal domain-containing protein [Chloroflexota bacterium]
MPTPSLEQVAAAIGMELPTLRFRYSQRDAVLYALGIGAPSDPLDADELRSVYELSPDFQVFPTFAVLFSKDLISQLMSGCIAGIQYEPMMLLHGEQELDLHRPLPPSASVISRLRIAEIYDKGSGALIIFAVESATEAGQKLASARISVFIRGIGGFGGQRGETVKLPPPARPPDIVHEEATRPSQALLYRLTGDANPLHADPAMAARGGYHAPILHGLCTFGFAARALINHCCANDASRLRSIRARFRQHVFPGETLITEIWSLPAGEIRFQTRSKERAAVVLSHAVARLVE